MGGKVKREKLPKTECSQTLYMLYYLQVELAAHEEMVAVISYSPHKDPSILLSVQNLMHCLHHLSTQATLAFPLLSSLPFLPI